MPVDLRVPVRVESEFPGQQAHQRLQFRLADAERAQQQVGLRVGLASSGSVVLNVVWWN